MHRGILVDLLDRNDDHVAALPSGSFDRQRDGQRPGVVSVCCSDSRVSQEGMFAVEEPGFLFTSGAIGNSVSALVDGERVLDGSVAYPLGHTHTEVLAVVGHTGCGAVDAALTAARTGEFPAEPGVRADVEALLPIVEAGLTDPAVVGEGGDVAGDRAGDENADNDADTSVRDRLVEYNVHEQVAFARESEEAADATVYGFVYDLHGVYGDRDGAVYLVNADGERDPATLCDLVGEAHADHVATLLER
ncbi:carbonic anhydrase [Halorubrum distributum JCM 9100]|uniref:carbonic anhydrase n=6 Tax=Halorubrum distributum TaxID=29283 RepID=M0F3Z9_9EURY|nr:MULTISPECIES: carbonic anhydrase [Halorubrum distributum group]ELZ33013.1 carbonic anhydrase [Halorubrum terrestre JCM 10247]ELZ53912.1 carbonic anhydrase [Halorubrum distributum JCM 9100]ELZ56404.1 carbonic anhydrase [Halorubrum distributum JCM 10118]EMA58012.1 carbonic anhydrase [Halorubrum litoreum JCM 13561]EMA68081.1 carbonic anhydrase [Halorubrum arcis JCM 13916]